VFVTPLKLNVMFARFPYGGNGGTSSEVPDIGDWLVETVLKMKADPRVGEIFRFRRSDTPIPMTRNLAVQEAKAAGADLLLMIDSDQAPDCELLEGDPAAKPFWDTSFDFVYQRKMHGLVTVVGAPYCGPPPLENVYVFRWANWQTDLPESDPDWRIEGFSREEAAGMAGIGPAAALPTGLILYDMDAFQHVPHPRFYYEYEGDGKECEHCGQRKPGPQSSKASTEDVTSTRDQALLCQEVLGYSPLFVNWDAWAGHWKPKRVRKPRPVTLDQIGTNYREAVLRGRRSDEATREIRIGPRLNGFLCGAKMGHA
jgi:hypothetical protein